MPRSIILLALVPVLNGCLAPVNLTYESARVLKKGQVDIQGNYSRYYYPEGFANTGGLTNSNYGAKLGYGITDNYTLKFRYEHLTVPSQEWLVNILGPITTSEVGLDYFEVENKIRFRNSRSAIGLPIAYYSSIDLFLFDPRWYITFPNQKNTFEVSVIPKAHIFIGEEIVGTPGLCIGMGFSSDLDRWAFRPEAGWDGYFSFGAALTFNLSPK